LQPGAPADVTIFDPEAATTVEASRFESKARNCPWDGMTLPGKILRTIVGGKTVFDGTQITA